MAKSTISKNNLRQQARLSSNSGWQSTRDTQLERFQEREEIPFKRFKITEEDWRNCEKWDVYRSAVCDMVDRTSTEISPWTLVEATTSAGHG